VIGLLVVAAFVLVALNSSGSSSGPTQIVVVAAADLPSRVKIDASSLTTAQVPMSGVQPGAYTKVSDVKGMVPLIDIKKGQTITSNLVGAANTVPALLPIPSGYVALTIPTGEQQGVGGYIQEGDYISIIATVSVGTKVSTQTVFTNIHVIKAGPLTTDKSTGAVTSASSLTVVVTECQAEYISWFLTFSSLKYTLESYHDYGPTATKDPAPDTACPSVSAAKGVTLSDVMAKYPNLF
jgi:Flp pilus assembly protein CpaB